MPFKLCNCKYTKLSIFVPFIISTSNLANSTVSAFDETREVKGLNFYFLATVCCAELKYK